MMLAPEIKAEVPDVKKGENQELLEMINEGLAKIKEDGTYDEILAQYE